MAHEPSINDFGLLIAYVLPGFVVLCGTTYLTDAARPWLGAAGDAPTVDGFLFVTLAIFEAECRFLGRTAEHNDLEHWFRAIGRLTLLREQEANIFSQS